METTTPPTVTGLSLAIGVSAPVRPTLISIASTIVVACSAGNLCATAQRGERETKPSRCCSVEIVDLVDDAVDVVAERRPLLFDGMILREHLRRGAAKLGQPKIGRQAEATHGLDGAELGRSEGLAHFAPGVGEKLQGPLGGHARIELTQGARGKVAWIGVDRLAGGGLARVERGEIDMAHVDFAARLEDLRRALKALWDRFDHAHVRGDVLAFVTVAARGRLDEFAILVAQAAGEPVDLRFRNDIERRALAQAQKAPHAGAELLGLLIGEDVAERQHRHAVADLGEFLRRRGADLAIGGVRIDKFGELLFKRGVAPAQRIVFGVGNGRRILPVIALVMLGDLGL